MTVTDNKDTTYTIALTTTEAALLQRIVTDFGAPSFLTWLTEIVNRYSKEWQAKGADTDLMNFRPRFDQLTSSQQAQIVSILGTVPK